MAMIKCPECGKEYSDTAKACPNCGYRKSHTTENKKLLIEIIAGVVFAILVVSLSAVYLYDKFTVSDEELHEALGGEEWDKMQQNLQEMEEINEGLQRDLEELDRKKPNF